MNRQQKIKRSLLATRKVAKNTISFSNSSLASLSKLLYTACHFLNSMSNQ